MAQTKASSKKRSASSGRSRSSAQKRTTSRGRTTASRNGSSKSKPVETVKDTVTTGAQNAAQGVAGFAKGAKTVLLAGGAAAAGAAAATAVSRSRNGRKVLGVSLPKRRRTHLNNLLPRRSGLKTDTRKVAGAVTNAAKRADQLGQRVSSVASSVQKVSESANDAAKKA